MSDESDEIKDLGWKTVSPLFKKPRTMFEVGVEGDRFNPHPENSNCVTSGCVPAVKRPEAKMNTVPLGVYRHFKGAEYDLVGISTNRDSGEQYAIYRNKRGDRMIEHRTLIEFTEHVDKPDRGYSGPRFYLIRAIEEDKL